MNPWITYAVVVWAVTYVISMSSIGSPLRAWVGHRSWFLMNLVYCPSCTSFWVGGIVGACGLFPVDLVPHAHPALAILVAAMISGATSLATVSLLFGWVFHHTSPAHGEMQSLIEHIMLEHPEKLPEELRAHAEQMKQMRAQQQQAQQQHDVGLRGETVVPLGGGLRSGSKVFSIADMPRAMRELMKKQIAEAEAREREESNDGSSTKETPHE